jgi:hypothetical protein
MAPPKSEKPCNLRPVVDLTADQADTNLWSIGYGRVMSNGDVSHGMILYDNKFQRDRDLNELRKHQSDPCYFDHYLAQHQMPKF